MAALKNRRHEKYAQLLANGVKQAVAYREVYPVSLKWKENTVWEKASRLAGDDKVRARVAELVQEAAKQAVVDASYVLKRLVEIDQMDAADILDDEGGLKPVSQWPKVWRTTLSGMDINRLSAIKDGEESVESIIQKIKWPDKLKNLELLGKHLSVGAFVEKVDHTSSDGSMTPTFGMMYGKPQSESD